MYIQDQVAMRVDVLQRASRARKLFEEGYNCAQSVVLAYSDLFEVDEQTLATLSAPFGGGMGRMREVCGTVSAMTMIAGVLTKNFNPQDTQSKQRCYTLVQLFAEKFKEENGSIVCRTLLGINKEELSPIAEKRTEQYYKKRPCSMLVEKAAKIVGEYLNSATETLKV